MTSMPSAGARLVGCRWCGQVHSLPALKPRESALCRRCGGKLAGGRQSDLRRTAAYSLAALILYWPANVFPILRLNMYGATTTNTVWQGCRRLYEGGDKTIALVVFLASIVVPFLKLAGLFALSTTSALRSARWRRGRTRLFRVIDAAGRWAMLDVFVLAIVVSLIRLQRLASAEPGAGALAFTGVVVFTLLASRSIDSRLIWEEP